MSLTKKQKSLFESIEGEDYTTSKEKAEAEKKARKLRYANMSEGEKWEAKNKDQGMEDMSDLIALPLKAAGLGVAAGGAVGMAAMKAIKSKAKNGKLMDNLSMIKKRGKVKPDDKLTKEGYEEAVEKASSEPTLFRGGSMGKVKLDPTETAKMKNLRLKEMTEKTDYSTTAKAKAKKEMEKIIDKVAKEGRLDEAFVKASEYTDKMNQKGSAMPTLNKADRKKSHKIGKMFKAKAKKFREERKKKKD